MQSPQMCFPQSCPSTYFPVSCQFGLCELRLTTYMLFFPDKLFQLLVSTTFQCLFPQNVQESLSYLPHVGKEGVAGSCGGTRSLWLIIHWRRNCCFGRRCPRSWLLLIWEWCYSWRKQRCGFFFNKILTNCEKVFNKIQIRRRFPLQILF